MSPSSRTLQVLTRGLHGDGKKKPALHWQCRKQEISPFQAPLCNSFTVKMKGEVESERRRKGSLSLCVLQLWCALVLQFNGNEINLLTSPNFRLQVFKKLPRQIFFRKQM